MGEEGVEEEGVEEEGVEEEGVEEEGVEEEGWRKRKVWSYLCQGCSFAGHMMFMT